jgi:hypothetical protein
MGTVWAMPTIGRNINKKNKFFMSFLLNYTSLYPKVEYFAEK